MHGRQPLRIALYVGAFITVVMQVPFAYDTETCGDGSLCGPTRGVALAGLVVERYPLTANWRLLGLAFALLGALTTWLVLSLHQRGWRIGARWNVPALVVAVPVVLMTQVDVVMPALRGTRISGALAVAAIVLLARRIANPAAGYAAAVPALVLAVLVWWLLYPEASIGTLRGCSDAEPHCNYIGFGNARGWGIGGTVPGEDPAMLEFLMKLRAWAIAASIVTLAATTRLASHSVPSRAPRSPEPAGIA